MIEVWIDNGEAFFCMSGLIDLHIRSGTVSRDAVKLMDLPTNSMDEAHKLFADHIAEDGAIINENEPRQEGWD